MMIMLRMGPVAFAVAIMVWPVLTVEDMPFKALQEISANAMRDDILATV